MPRFLPLPPSPHGSSDAISNAQVGYAQLLRRVGGAEDARRTQGADARAQLLESPHANHGVRHPWNHDIWDVGDHPTPYEMGPLDMNFKGNLLGLQIDFVEDRHDKNQLYQRRI